MLAFVSEHKHTGISSSLSYQVHCALHWQAFPQLSPKSERWVWCIQAKCTSSMQEKVRKCWHPDLTCDFTCEVSAEKILCNSDIQPSFSSPRLNKADHLCWKKNSIHALQWSGAFVWFCSCPQKAFCWSSSFHRTGQAATFTHTQKDSPQKKVTRSCKRSWLLFPCFPVNSN